MVDNEGKNFGALVFHFLSLVLALGPRPHECGILWLVLGEVPSHGFRFKRVLEVEGMVRV